MECWWKEEGGDRGVVDGMCEGLLGEGGEADRVVMRRRGGGGGVLVGS